MEFRNHQTKILHQLQQMRGNPIAAVLFALLFLVILVPVLALVLLGLVVSLVTLPLRLYLASRRRANGTQEGPFQQSPFQGGPFQGQGPFGATPFGGAPESRSDDSPDGPVIDVEVTRSETR